MSPLFIGWPLQWLAFTVAGLYSGWPLTMLGPRHTCCLWLACLASYLDVLDMDKHLSSSAIRTLYILAVTVGLPAAPDQLLQSPTSLSSTLSSSSSTATHDGTVAAHGSSSSSSSSSLQDTPASEGSQQEELAQQQPVLANISKATLAAMLQRCSNPAVRQQLHQQVLQPKLQQAARLLSQLSRCAVGGQDIEPLASMISMMRRLSRLSCRLVDHPVM